MGAQSWPKTPLIQSALWWDLSCVRAGPDGSFVSTGVYNLEVPGWIPVVADICHRGCCAYTVLQNVQMHGVYSAAMVLCSVHYIETLKSFEMRVGHNTGFGFPSVAILQWLCRKRHKAIFTHVVRATECRLFQKKRQHESDGGIAIKLNP